MSRIKRERAHPAWLRERHMELKIAPWKGVALGLDLKVLATRLELEKMAEHSS